MRWRWLSVVFVVLLSHLARAQAVSPGHALGCDLCHVGHVRKISLAGRLVMATRTNASGPPVVAPPGLTPISVSCLRCHHSTTVRATEMTSAQLVATGGVNVGKYVGSTLFTSHKMGGGGEPQCFTCHRVHVPGQLQPGGTLQRAICTTCHASQRNHPDPSHLTVACSTCHTIHTTYFGNSLPSQVIGIRDPDALAPLASIEGDLAPKRARSPQPHTAIVRGDMDRECLSCHAVGSGGANADRLPSVQIDLLHIQRGSCIACHKPVVK